MFLWNVYEEFLFVDIFSPRTLKKLSGDCLESGEAFEDEGKGLVKRLMLEVFLADFLFDIFWFCFNFSCRTGRPRDLSMEEGKQTEKQDWCLVIHMNIFLLFTFIFGNRILKAAGKVQEFLFKPRLVFFYCCVYWIIVLKNISVWVVESLD